jgi:tetratricopeptide (TPR) repeat protein
VLLGVCLSRQQRWEDALRVLAGVGGPARGALSPTLRDTLDYETALAMREAGRADDATDAYERAIEQARSPSIRAHAMLDLAGIRMEGADPAAGADLLRQVLDLAEVVALEDAVVEVTTYRLGVCEQRLGDHERVVSALAPFAERWEDSALVASASLICAESLVSLGRNGEAIEHLERAVERGEDESVTAPALLRLGQCQAALTRWAPSERTYARFLREHPEHPLAFQARFGHAWAIENQGRPAEAIALYAEVVETHDGPTAARAQFQIGECHFALGDHESAVRELLRVDILYDYPEWSAAALYEAGRCFESMRRPDEAREHYEMAAARDPDSEWAGLAGQRLSALAPAPLPGRDD